MQGILLTMRLTVKYGQVPFCRPYSSTSAKVHIPGGTRLPGSISFKPYTNISLKSMLRVTTLQTSCHSHKGTEPGSARPFSHAEELVRSRQRASTTFPFFSLDTYFV